MRVELADEGGAPMMVTVTIAGRPGAYTGRAATPEPTMPLQAVATTPNGMIALFNMAPDGVVSSVACRLCIHRRSSRPRE